MQLRLISNSIAILVITSLLSCGNTSTSEKISSHEEKEFEYLYSDRSFFFLEGDTICMIPETWLRFLYSSEIDNYYKKYPNYQAFLDDFFKNRNGKFADELAKRSTKTIADKRILTDYNQLSFNDFIKKYCRVTDHDTILIKKDITVAYCLDKYSYDCPIFCEVDSVAIIKRHKQ